jgi:hypothetical protein
MRARIVPHVGSPVTVIYLGATVPGIIEQVDDDGRRLVVVTQEGGPVGAGAEDALGYRRHPAGDTAHVLA